MGLFDFPPSIDLIDLAKNLILFFLAVIFSLLSIKTYKHVKDIPTQSLGTSNLRSVLEEILNKLNSVEYQIDERTNSTMETQMSHLASLDNTLRVVRSEIQRLEQLINDVSSAHESLVSEFKALPKPSSYIRFPTEYQKVYDDLNNRMREMVSRVQSINNNYDVIIFQPILSFILSELEDITVAQVPIENIAGRLAVIERLLNCILESFDKPEIIRRMKALKEEGFSEKLVLRY